MPERKGMEEIILTLPPRLQISHQVGVRARPGKPLRNPSGFMRQQPFPCHPPAEPPMIRLFLESVAGPETFFA